MGLKFKTWSDEPWITSNFKMTSKYTDLGTPDTKKSILGIILNLSILSSTSSDNHTIFNFNIYHRTSTTSGWKPLTSFNNTYTSDIDNSSSMELVYMLTNPISGLVNFQLQIRGTYIKNDVGINDMGIIFRKHRDSSTVNFDE